MRGVFGVMSLLLFSSVSVFGACDSRIDSEFKSILNMPIKDIGKLKQLYNKCTDDAIQSIIFLAQADELENDNKLDRAFEKYKASLNTLEEVARDRNFDSDGGLRVYLNSQIAKYGVVSSEGIEKRYIVSKFTGRGYSSSARSARGAELEEEYKLKSLPLNFQTGKDSILKGVNMQQANNIAKALKKYPNRVVYITGYTDTRGLHQNNYTLGESRADNLKRYLKRKGIKNEIETDSKGEAIPICIGGETIDDKKDSGGYRCSQKEDYYGSRRVVIAIGE